MNKIFWVDGVLTKRCEDCGAWMHVNDLDVDEPQFRCSVCRRTVPIEDIEEARKQARKQAAYTTGGF